MKLSKFLLLGLLCLLGGWHPLSAETIKSFDVLLRVNKDSSFNVTETIVYDFQGAQRRGIYRDIPVVYERKGGKYTIYLTVRDVTNGAGSAWQWKQEKEGRNLRIRIGNPDVFLSGIQTYKLRYTVRRAVNYFEAGPEVYWNATGDEWGVPMGVASLRLVPPPGVKTSSIRVESFVGPPGSASPGLTQVRDNDILFYTYDLSQRQGLTVVAGLPKGSMVQPSTLQIVRWFMADWWPAIVFPILTLGVLFTLWHNNGRDAEGHLAAQVEWAPPQDLSPAEVGTLLDERCDMADIVSTLVDLAARGYLCIEETKTQTFLFFSTRDYKFHQLAPPENPSTPLAPHEKEFLEGLFGYGLYESAHYPTVTLSSLKNKFYTHIPKIEASIYASLASKNLFTADPRTIRTIYQVTGGVIMGLGLLALVILGQAYGDISYSIGLVTSGIMVMLSARAMPAKTATGSRKLRECLGFQRFVQLAERDRIRVLAAEDPLIFGRLLPYAMVLGVADAWADKFAGLLTQPPSWYVPYNAGPSYVFHSSAFVNDLGGGMNSMASTFGSKPQSTGGSGGSGFSGGGSGGGFGGGGGGSW